MSLDRTEAQRAASRTNGAKSHGPTTALGKRISAMNGSKHSLFADILLLPGENRDAFTALSTNFFTVLSPRNDMEDLYVQRMVECEWHLRRIRDYQQAAMMVEISAQGPDPDIPIDGQIWNHPSARESAAFQNLYGRASKGSAIQTSRTRYLREFKEAQTQIAQIARALRKVANPRRRTRPTR